MKLIAPVLNFVRGIGGNSDLGKIASNTGWLVADKGIRMIMALVIGVWIARYLGPENYGVWSYSNAIVLIFLSLATLGIDGLVVRDLAMHPQNESRILGSSLYLRLMTAAIVYCLSIVCVYLLKGADGLTFTLVAILGLSFFFQSFDVIDFFFQSKLQSRYTIMARLTALILANGLRVTAIVLALSLFAFGWIQVAEYFLAALFLLYAYKRLGGKALKWVVDKSYSKDLVRSCYGLLVDSMLVVVTMQVDRIILEYFHGDKVVGTYSVAVNLAQLWYFVPVFLGASVVPILIRKREESIALYERYIQKIWSILFYISIIISIAFTFASGLIVEFLYGTTFIESAPVLSVYIWCCIFVFHVSIRSRSMIIEKKEKYIGIFSVMMTIVYVTLNFFLAQKFYALGAAVSSLIAWAASVFLFPLFFAETRRYPLYFIKSFKI